MLIQAIQGIIPRHGSIQPRITKGENKRDNLRSWGMPVMVRGVRTDERWNLDSLDSVSFPTSLLEPIGYTVRIKPIIHHPYPYEPTPWHYLGHYPRGLSRAALTAL